GGGGGWGCCTRPRARPPRPHDRFQPFGTDRARRVLAFLKSAGVPASDRRAWPLVCSGERVLWVTGLRPDDAFRASPGAQRVLVLQWRPDRP
ncbi:MAG: hypothetical protein IRZ18_04455, partial [Clostridia bacterium]|nr:hypothetical protein [Clostridia bacterium]